MKSLSVTIQMKATEQYFPVVLFIMLYKVVLTFKSVDEMLKCARRNGNRVSLPESAWPINLPTRANLSATQCKICQSLHQYLI